MTVSTLSVTEKLAQTQEAMKAGLLDTYAPAVSVKSGDDAMAAKSWGTAMRR